MALPNDIIRTIKDYGRRLANLESNPQPPAINLSNTSGASFSLTASGTAGEWALISSTLASGDSKRLLAQPNISLYLSGGTAADVWPNGSNWTAQQRRDLLVTTWLDWANTDNNNVILRTLVLNKGTGTFNLIYECNFRFMTKEASV